MLGIYGFIHAHTHMHKIVCINNCPTRCNTNRLFIILQVHSTCFGCQPHPSSGVHKTVTTATGNVHIFCAATSLQDGHLATLEEDSCTKTRPVPQAVVTVLCTPDDGCG